MFFLGGLSLKWCCVLILLSSCGKSRGGITSWFGGVWVYAVLLCLLGFSLGMCYKVGFVCCCDGPKLICGFIVNVLVWVGGFFAVAFGVLMVVELGCGILSEWKVLFVVCQ